MSTTIANISTAAEGTNLLRITYVDSKNKQTVRSVEPYELKDGKLFAYDTQKESIRAFKLSSIFSAEILEKVFTPRYPVKIASVMPND